MRFARGKVKPRDKGMNGFERAYSEDLEKRKLVGEILFWRYEAIKIRLADNTFYTPDFMIMLPDGELEFHEVKGFWQDAGRVKIKVVADQYPFRFIAVTRQPKKLGGGWVVEEI